MMQPSDIGMIVIDLDGTVLGNGPIDQRDIDAVNAAMDRGIEVVVATGRSWKESRDALRQLRHRGVMIGAGGAMLHETESGATLDRSVLNANSIQAMTASLVEHGFLVNLLQDSMATGFDYWMVGPHEPHPATSWWFEHHDITARWVDHLDEVEAFDHTVRVGAVGHGQPLAELSGRLKRQMGSDAVVQYWEAVVESPAEEGTDSIYLFEGFDAGVDKWTMIEGLLESRGLEPRNVVAIGDGLNDIGMLSNAGLGIAMANAKAEIQAVADQVTGPIGGGVADAINGLLSSR